MIAGVAAGLATHLRIDATLVRIGFVLAALVLEGLGILAYGLLWILVPEPAEEADGAVPHGPTPAAGDQRDPARGGPGLRGSSPRGAGFWAGVALVVVGALWLVPAGGLWGAPFGRGWLLPLALIGVGAALWVSNERDDEPVPGEADAGPTTSWRPPPDAAATGAGPSGATTVGAAGASPTSDVAAPPPDHGEAGPPPPPAGGPPGPPAEGGSDGVVPEPPVRERSVLTRCTIGLALLVVGGLWLLRQADALEVGAVDLGAVALLVVAAGLLVGAWWGRGRPLILLGLLLAPLVLLGLVRLDIPWSGTVGDRWEVPDEVGLLHDEYDHAAGRFTLDLTELEPTEDVATSIDAGAGEVHVLLPEDLALELDVSTGMGELDVLDRWQREGLGPQLERAVDGAGPATLDLRVRLGAGRVEVRRAPAGPEPAPTPDRLGAPGAVGPALDVPARIHQEVTR